MKVVMKTVQDLLYDHISGGLVRQKSIMEISWEKTHYEGLAWNVISTRSIDLK